ADGAVVQAGTVGLPPEPEPGEGTRTALARTLMDLVADERCPMPEAARRDHLCRHTAQRLARLETRIDVEPAKPLGPFQVGFDPFGVGDGPAQHLQAAADPQHEGPSGGARKLPDLLGQAGRTEPAEGADGGAGPGQNDQVGPTQLSRL